MASEPLTWCRLMDSDKTLWTMWGRPVRPGTFILSVITASLGVNATLGSTSLTGTFETVAGIIALISAAALWVGWWAKSLTAMLAGLLLATWTWATAAWAAAQTPGVTVQTVISASCWCGLAAGLWLRDRREQP